MEVWVVLLAIMLPHQSCFLAIMLPYQSCSFGHNVVVIQFMWASERSYQGWIFAGLHLLNVCEEKQICMRLPVMFPFLKAWKMDGMRSLPFDFCTKSQRPFRFCSCPESLYGYEHLEFKYVIWVGVLFSHWLQLCPQLSVQRWSLRHWPCVYLKLVSSPRSHCICSQFPHKMELVGKEQNRNAFW